ncbi:MAG TPA: chemotaxis response regulator protein-glutamate methylesterase [Planctomycetaceae bacterium]|nr:chemotaxis response regulator protein-glutamate methylesterase [Planctomycetaceae bacterium]
MKKIRVLVVDDSALMRKLISEMLSSAPDIEVVGTAGDPYKARDRILKLNPDVLTLDVEMPRMDGLTFLANLMRARPMPVIMISSLTSRGCEVTVRALELGIVDFVTKPHIDLAETMITLRDSILTKVRLAARSQVSRPAEAIRNNRTHSTNSVKPASLLRTTQKIIVIGASTGGTQAISRVLPELPADMPGIVIVIHMPPGFTRSFADRLNEICALTVREASDGEKVLPGHALVAPGNLHTTIVRNGAEYAVAVGEGQPVNQFRPSVDVLFHSCAASAGENSLGIILTGMGCDGANGLLAMRQAGAPTIAQDRKTSVVFGMPKQAIARGGVRTVCPLENIASQIVSDTREIMSGDRTHLSREGTSA